MSVNLQTSGDISIAGDVVGRDKIINNIQNIVQRALTEAEDAQNSRDLERAELAKGVNTVAQRLQARAGDDTLTRGNPYKGLLTYRLGDAGLFFGRSHAIQGMVERLSASAFTVLHAESGAGKSSLIQAGLMPRLIANGHLPIFLRPYNVEPYLAIKRAFLPDLSVAPLLATGPLRDFLRQVASVLGAETRLYVFLDQMEELFTQQPEPARAEFVRELADCLDDEALHVRWALALRTEFFGNLASFRPQISNPFANDYRLNRLTKDEAREVVIEPARRRGAVYEGGLVDSILSDLGQAEISPPEIQLVCSALYDDLPRAETTQILTITRAMYDGQGGAVGILRDHLDRVLTRDVPGERQAAARRLMEALISSDGRRVIRARSVLVSEVAPLNVSAEAFDGLVGQLIDSRLLRSLEPTAEHPETGYELSHDYLVSKIALDPAVQARKAAQELLEQEVQSFKRHGTLLSEQKLSIIEAREAELSLADEAKELIRKSQRALRRQRRLQIGGLTLIVLLTIVSVIAVTLVWNAGAQVQSAEGTRQAAEQAALGAQQEQANSLATSNAAATQAFNAEAGANLAATQQAQAELSANAAQAVAADAEERAEVARQVVRQLFEQDGIVPLDDQPIAFAFDFQNQRLWVVTGGRHQAHAINPETGDIVANVNVGEQPTALAWVNEKLWVASRGEGTVQVVDPNTGEVAQTFDVEGEPFALLYLERQNLRQMWVASQQSDTIQVIDLNTNTVGDPIRPGAQPLALAFAGRNVWVATRQAARNENFVWPINPATGALEEPVTVGARPAALAYDDVYLWVANQDSNSLQAINPASHEIITTITITTALRPGALLFDGQWMWIANQGDNTVQAFDPNACQRLGEESDAAGASSCISAPIEVGNLPQALAFTGNRVWVANFSSQTAQALDLVAAFSIDVGRQPRRLLATTLRGQPQIWVANQNDDAIQSIDIDPKTGDPLTGRASLPLRMGDEPRSLAFDGQYLWVTNSAADQVIAVDPATGRWARTARTESEGRPRAILYDEQNRRVWFVNNRSGTLQAVRVADGVAEASIQVGNGAFDLILVDGQLWVSNSTDDTIQSVNPVSGEVGEPVAVCDNPGAMAYDGKQLWVACFDDNEVRPLDLSADPPQLGASIKTAAGPSGLALDEAHRRLWVANFRDNTVQYIPVDAPPDQLQASKPIRVDLGPIFAIFAHDRLWLADFNANRVQYLIVQEHGQ
jgi:DNA-binding beta-propeller fold protein YncE